jgi:hypothetical protein
MEGFCVIMKDLSQYCLTASVKILVGFTLAVAVSLYSGSGINAQTPVRIKNRITCPT